MKKLTGIILALLLASSLGTTAVFAASGRGHGNRTGCGIGTSACAFVDANNDGICDTHKENCSFSDVDKDGICDTCPSGGAHLHDGTGKKNGRGNGCNNT